MKCIIFGFALKYAEMRMRAGLMKGSISAIANSKARTGRVKYGVFAVKLRGF